MDEWAQSRDLEPASIGWCHHCMTFQRFKHARRTPNRRGLCVNPDCDQTWGFGVWDMRDAPDFESFPCWGEHADRNDVFFPGQCGHAKAAE
jgi:hypothetical protein